MELNIYKRFPEEGGGGGAGGVREGIWSTRGRKVGKKEKKVTCLLMWGFALLFVELLISKRSKGFARGQLWVGGGGGWIKGKLTF